MTTREKIHHLVDRVPENQLEGVWKKLKQDFTEESEEVNPSETETPEDFLKKFGTWEDDRTTEEIIQDIYSSRRSSTRTIDL